MSNSSRKVVVIGAGIVGVSTAIWCQRQGHEVVLIDRDGPASGTSFGNAGILAAYSVVPVTVPGLIQKAPKMAMDPESPLFMRWSYLLRLMPWLRGYLKHCNVDDVRRIAAALTPILADSLEQHRALSDGTGAEQFVHASDYLYVYADKDAYSADRFTWDIRREFNFTWSELNHDELRQYDPVYDGGSAGYAANADDHGRISDPGRYVQSLAAYFQREGGVLKIATVESLAEKAGQVCGVVTDQGTESCEVAVIASGVWSGAITKQLGVSIPMEAEGGYHLELINPTSAPASPAMLASYKFVATPMEGRLRCAGLVEFGGLKSTADRKPLELLKRQVQAVYPSLQYERTEEWLGFRPAPIDSIPLIGEFDTLRGVYAGFGHQHVGLTGGAKTGRVLAALISGEDPGIDMQPYRTSRFT